MAKKTTLTDQVKIRGIRKRWLVNSLAVVMALLVAILIILSTALRSYYYSNMENGLTVRAENMARGFGRYSAAEFRSAAQSAADGFEEKSVLELQFLDVNGVVFVTSRGLTVGMTPDTPDISAALENQRSAPWRGSDPATGERIMAVTTPVVSGGEMLGLVRYITSLAAVQKQLVLSISLIVLIEIAILAMVYFSNLYFVRSIVEPLAGLTEAARLIADGSYGVQIEKQYDDEIGELTDTINNMSLKIQQAEKTQSEFISSVSHELRTPLTAINGWAETIQSGELQDPADVKKGMDIIVSEARRLTNMVEELLEFSRISEGRFTLSVEKLDLRAGVEDAVYTYKEFFRKEGIELTYEECQQEYVPITGDPERLRQVFCNMLDNAAKHGGSGKRIDVSLTTEGDRAVLRVRDYGPGIPEEELPFIKQKFYKGSSKARGSGIGLAVCEEIVTRHEGTLDITNAPGGGCLVTIRLPLEEG